MQSSKTAALRKLADFISRPDTTDKYQKLHTHLQEAKGEALQNGAPIDIWETGYLDSLDLSLMRLIAARGDIFTYKMVLTAYHESIPGGAATPEHPNEINLACLGAIRQGHPAMVSALLTLGANPNYINPMGHSMFAVATQVGNDEITQIISQKTAIKLNPSTMFAAAPKPEEPELGSASAENGQDCVIL